MLCSHNICASSPAVHLLLHVIHHLSSTHNYCLYLYFLLLKKETKYNLKNSDAWYCHQRNCMKLDYFLEIRKFYKNNKTIFGSSIPQI